MKTRKHILSSFAALFIGSFLYGQCGGNIDLSTDWSKKGPASAGTWTVGGGGSSVTQTINGLPTFYVSGDDYIDVKISGTIKVNTTNDDDFIGFVFGYSDPITPPDGQLNNYYLFDWKQKPQPGGTANEEGYRLTKVDSILDYNNAGMMDLFWHNTNTTGQYPGFRVMDSLVGPGTGWTDFATYNFTLTYTSKLILIEINGDTIFNVPGCYQGGKFGFYNMSQDQVIYSNFSYELIPNFDFSSTDACINQYTNFNAVNDACFSGGYVSPIQSWSWDMGDGTIINDTNIVYSYSKPGTYPVTLTVEDGTGCQTPITKNFVVRGLVAQQNDTIICPGASTQVWCNLAEAGASYQWFKDGTPITTPTVDDTLLNVSASGNYTVQISNTASYLCNTTSNSLTITVENVALNLNANDSVVCSATPVNFSVNTITGASYSWYKDGSSIAGETGTSYSSNQTGSYHVEILSQNGCNFKSDTIILNAGTTPSASITSGTTHFCPGNSSTLNATLQTGESVVWNKGGTPIAGETGTSLTVSSAGNYTATITNTDGCSATSNAISITIDPVPTASFTSSDPNFCPGIDSIQLNANAVTGASYAWLNSGVVISGANNIDYTTTNPGDYQVIVTNLYGCKDTSAAQTFQTATVGTFAVSPSDTSFCSGNSAVLSVNNESGSTFTWYKNVSAVGTGTSKSVSSSGDYYTKIVNNYGCITYSDTTYVNVLPLPTASISTGLSSICSGDSTVITAILVSGASYEWFKGGVSLGSPVVNNNTLSVGAVGAYKVVVSNACSQTSNTLNITQNYPPNAAGTIFGTTLFCPGESNDYSVNTVVGATSYTWEVIPTGAASISIGQGTTDVTVNTTNQSFTLKVTPSNACGDGAPSTLTVSVGDPQTTCALGVLFAANITNICIGSTVTFTNYTNPNNYVGLTPVWDFGAGASPATANGNGPISVTYSTSGYKTVSLSYEDGFGNVYDSETKVTYINVNGTVATSAIAGNSSLNCGALGENYSVTNTPGSTYQWTVPSGATILSGQGTNSILVNFATTGGNVSVQETNSAGCVGSVVNFSVSINNNVSTSSITGNTSVNCGETGLAYSVTNTAGSSYQWSVPAGATIVSGQGTNSIVVNFSGTSGNVSVQETSSAGCTGNLVTLPISVNGSVNTSAITGNQSVKCDASNETYSVANTTGSTYQWSVPTGATIVSGQGSNSIVVNFNGNMGTVSVVETSSGGCEGAAVSIIVSCSQAGIKENSANSMFSLYPNPATEWLNIETTVTTSGTIYIYDTDGKLVLMHDFGSEKIITISVNELVSGMHFGRIVSGTAVQTFKFIKQ